jgi:hypothetical protein
MQQDKLVIGAQPNVELDPPAPRGGGAPQSGQRVFRSESRGAAMPDDGRDVRPDALQGGFVEFGHGPNGTPRRRWWATTGALGAAPSGYALAASAARTGSPRRLPRSSPVS